jgi:CHAT domain-containing protein
MEIVELDGVAIGADTPLGLYLAAFDAAMVTTDQTEWRPGGFRGRPQAQPWADALGTVGEWTYRQILGPLIARVSDWSLDHVPHLALVALGEFAAIPFTAAWTADPTLPGNRRYAVHDLVLTHTVSARLLADVVRRPRRELTERVVLVTDPGAEFPYTRRIAEALAGRQYLGAELYGRKPARSGPPTTAALLAALPGRDEPGASLLHLSTHATTTPTPRLRTADGWLPLTRILDHARNRPPESAGGLIITNACLTDSTSAHQDQSLTLATAFLAAGATAVIGTRWPIDDDTAAVLAYRLHHHLLAGHPPAAALRLTQLDLLAPGPVIRRGLHPHLAAIPDDRLAHPASWAGYVHHGI